MGALSTFDRPRYLALHYAILTQLGVADRVARTVLKQPLHDSPLETFDVLKERLARLFERDLENVEAGFYPRELLFQLPTGRYLRCLPGVLADVPRIMRRMRHNDFSALPHDVEISSYPAYYRRTFHWQSDGYLSRASARRYDATVELLFRGTADVMRRQIIPPITRHLHNLGDPTGLRILDLATGTGRALSQVASAHPKQRYFGVDLSPYYLAEARRALDHVENLSLLVENAEALPFVDGYFDVITSVFLLHELPKNARTHVLREMLRILKPGGLLVLEDSVQLSDSPEVGTVLASFAEDFHEPYYKGYIQDDLGAALRARGFDVGLEETHLFSKVVAANKPD